MSNLEVDTFLLRNISAALGGLASQYSVYVGHTVVCNVDTDNSSIEFPLYRLHHEIISLLYSSESEAADSDNFRLSRTVDIDRDETPALEDDRVVREQRRVWSDVVVEGIS